MFHGQGNGPDPNTTARSFEMAGSYQFTSKNALVARSITESRWQILQLVTYLHSERGLLFWFEKFRRQAINEIFFQLVMSFEPIAECRYHLLHAFDLTRTITSSGSWTIAHNLNCVRQLVHEKVMVTVELRDCLTRFCRSRSLVCALTSVSVQSLEYGGKQMQVFAANVHGQARPEEIETRERRRGVAFVKRCQKRAQQFVQRLMILGEQSFRAWWFFR
jgi:hypothetical protein